MPLTRYFLVVGTALLALLLLANACLPTPPLSERAESNQVVIRIHADPKWPERVDYDTNAPTIRPQPTASTEDHTSDPPTTTAHVPAAAREAFAQLQPSNAVQTRPPETRKREAKLHQRKPAKRRMAPQEFFMARQARFDWFGHGAW
ncbi:hypothetical protein JQ596_17115 [Bradyrhizobium manausense]|uniref:hypothetical protein n=1 Tax=Bradyrhizobium TaxID=374 RepID=UPI001BA49B26|nr:MULTISPECIES: hypothetical protein [Bradyrhizobium]MBR0827247.1 hypothetical protein [Bradyrhizobium manausense]UVO27216.1 hypothetical protein KUF59_32630 [Bradyrhizobium arachidis]